MTTTDRTERYIVKPAAEMAPDEPCLRYTAGDVERCVHDRNLYSFRTGILVCAINTSWGSSSHLAFVCALVDLHDSWHTSRRPTAPASSERYDPPRHVWSTDVLAHDHQCTCGETAEHDYIVNGPGGAVTDGPCNAAFQPYAAKVREADQRRKAPAPSRPPEPTEADAGLGHPSDVEIAAAYDLHIQLRESDYVTNPKSLHVGDRHGDCILVRAKGHWLIHIDKCKAARTRVLRAKVAASKERERMTVLVDIDDPEFS